MWIAYMFIDVDIMISGQVKTRIDYLPYTLFHDFLKVFSKVKPKQITSFQYTKNIYICKS